MMLTDHTQNVRSLARSFLFALHGVVYCLRNERNMRIHFVAAVYVFVFSPFFRLGVVHYAVLVLVIGGVFAAEALNTAVEVIVNRQAQCYDNLARIAKDTAAAAVFICALTAVAVGCLFFIRPAAYAAIFRFLVGRPAAGIGFVLSIPAALLFIFHFPLIRRSVGPLPSKIKKLGR